jgi:DNA-binding XRE family transcriptional regulator
MRTYLPGLLDPLIKCMPTGQMTELALVLGVNRKTVYKWQRKKPISNFNKARLNALCVNKGIAPLFKEVEFHLGC